MVEPSLRVQSGRHACGLDESPDVLCQLRRTGRAVLHVVGMLREARIVIQHGRVWTCHHGEFVLFPMAGYDQHRIRYNANLARDFRQRLFQKLQLVAEFLHIRPRSAAMRDEISR